MLVGFKSRNHPQQTRSAGSRRHVDDRALPSGDFAPLQERFKFTLDAAASAHNHKLPHYFSEEDCGLRNSWAHERVYCNPPYSDVRPWLVKAWSERSADLIVMLLPANRTEQGWWHDLIETKRDRVGSPLKVEFLRHRRRFLKPGQAFIGPNERPRFGCCLLIWEWESA